MTEPATPGLAGTPTTPPRGGRVTAALALFLLVLAVAVLFVARNRTLGVLGGLTDEYFALGAKLRTNGTLGLAAGEPSALRPPGYPAFIALVLAASVDSPARLSLAQFERSGQRAVSLAQCLLLAVCAVMLFLWLEASLGMPLAWGAGAFLGLNPFSLVLVGLLHYDLLHWTSLIAACWCTERAVRNPQQRWRWLAAGLLWALSNLVRPVSLILPLLALPALWLVGRLSLRRAAGAALWLALGLAAGLLPWTLRNHRVTGRFVPIADNAWTTLWGQTVKPLGADPARYLWFDLYRDDLVPVFRRVTGEAGYDYVVHNRHTAAVEAGFRAAALDNLRRQPGVYLRNCATALWTFNVHVSSILIAASRALQGGADAGAVRQDWFLRGAPGALPADGVARGFAALFGVLSALALAGAIGAAHARSPLVVAAAPAYLAICLTHALVFFHLMHYYVKLPFVVAFAFAGIGYIARRPPHGGRVARGLLVALCAWNAVLVALTVFA